jgi:pyruvate,water dikinase
MSCSSPRRIVWLDAPEANDVGLTGGKCRSLAALSAAGLPVPSGFVVSTHAYREALFSLGLDREIEAALANRELETPEAAEAAARQIAGLLSGQSVPSALTGEIGRAYSMLCEKLGYEREVAVAVRSSATAEDLTEASFAGQQETYLNITGAERVAQAIRDCWASLFSPRVLAYRGQRSGWQLGSLAMAVGVQVMVPARVAGVLFTVNPQTGDRSQLVIEASWGLGESVVGGLVTPDRFVVDKRTGQTIETRIGQKSIEVVCGPHGTDHQEVPPPKQCLPCLTLENRERLAEIGRRVEELFGVPQDIEWAVDASDHCFVLQARPDTARPLSQSQSFPRSPAYQELYRSLIWNTSTPQGRSDG